MIRRNQEWLNRLNQLLDFLLVVFAYVFASWFRLVVLRGDRSNMAISGRMLLISALFAFALIFILTLTGFYGTTRTRRLGWKLQAIFLSCTAIVLVGFALLFLYRLVDFSRGVLFLFYAFTLTLLFGKYILMRMVFNQLRAQGYNIKHEIVVGTGKTAKEYAANVAREPELGIDILAFAGGVEDLDLSRKDIDEVVIALEAEEYAHIGSVISACEKNGVKYLVIPFYNDIIPAHPVIENVGTSKLINMRANRLENVGWSALKRLMDILASALGLLILSPLLAVIAVGVKLSSPGPVLFRQTRVGYKRREFEMLKFRSMRVNDASGTAWSTNTDSRRTPFGSLIRKTSLDELPQLWNVLRGDMSLVGPRPELPKFVDAFRETIPLYMVKHQVKPGMTGWAQVNGCRGDTSIEKRIELDLWYIDNWSFGLDLWILLRTLFGGMINREKLGAQGEKADIRIVVAAHKKYRMPADPMYLPLQVGAAGKPDLGWMRDDTGDNISEKNATYCELTGLYWAWKNLTNDYIGLAHYRRLFRGTHMPVDRADILLPKKRHYWIETNYSQYAHAHHAIDLDETRRIITERCPEYTEAFDQVMKRRSGHRFNMFIMKRPLLNSYCAWLFDILFELEKRLDISAYSANDRRVFGFVAERLLDVWLEKNGCKTLDIPYVFLEKQNWLTKGTAFVMRKLKAG